MSILLERAAAAHQLEIYIVGKLEKEVNLLNSEEVEECEFLQQFQSGRRKKQKKCFVDALFPNYRSKTSIHSLLVSVNMTKIYY